MDIITGAEWESINRIILDIYAEDNSRQMRRAFLKSLRLLISFDLAEFSLGDNNLKFFDSIEANMVSGEKVNILEKYYFYKNLYGNENQDWIFQYPRSYVISNKTSNLKPGIFENSIFNTMFLKAINMNYCCTVTLRNEGFFLGELSLYNAGDFDFSERDIYILNQLKDHLSNRLRYFHKKDDSVKISDEQLEYFIKANVTEREIQLIKLLLTDMTNDSIAKEMCISINTVKKHIGNIFGKLDVKTRMQLKNKLHR